MKQKTSINYWATSGLEGANPYASAPPDIQLPAGKSLPHPPPWLWMLSLLRMRSVGSENKIGRNMDTQNKTRESKTRQAKTIQDGRGQGTAILELK